jgi:hypothetical protein
MSLSAHDDPQYADPAKATTYTLIAYAPSYSTHEGCHCHGTTQYFDSKFEMVRGLTFEQLALAIVRLRTETGDDDRAAGGYEFKYFDDQAPPDWDEGDHRGFDDALEALVSKQEPIIKQRKQRKAAAEKAAAEKAAADEKIRRQEREAAERERRDREEYQRLKTKFTPKET